MTETERLRAMLDERGVFWTEHIELQGVITVWMGWQFFEGTAEYNMGWTLLSMADATPEQAVEATLGRGTCEILGYDDGYDEGLDGEMYQYADPRYFLSCEHEAYGSVAPNYCPVCGRKVVDA